MDMGTLAFELFIIIALALLNGVLSMSEMAMVSARKIRLQQAAQNGSAGAKTALELLEEPSRFLAAIQIGITMIGVFAGAFGGANMSEELGRLLSNVPFLAPYASPIGLGSVVVLVTLLSLILGELVPKRLALGHSEGIAIFMAKPITWISFLSRPAVRFLSAATEGILRLFRYRQPDDPPVSDDEVRILMEQGAQAGVFEKEEEDIIKRTLKLSDRSVSEVMTQRLHLVCLDIEDPIDVLMEKISLSIHSYFPIFKGDMDEIVGVVSIKHLFSLVSKKVPIDLSSIMQEPLFIPESMAALKLLGRFKSSGKHFALVIDEYGGLSGVVTAIDLLESIVGDLPSEHGRDSDSAVAREDGSWLVDGIILIENLSEFIPVPEQGFFDGDYQTLGGFMMVELGHVPRLGERILWKGWSFEVVDMDGNRVDKVLVYPPIEQGR